MKSLSLTNSHPALEAIRHATLGTPFENDLFLVGGAVRDELLGRVHDTDFDLVTRGPSAHLAHLLYAKGVSTIAPVTYPRFGTAMVHVEGVPVELVTARKESYTDESRKPTVEPATYEEDAARRDFTVNALYWSIHSEHLSDPTAMGLPDLENEVLRTPLDPDATFYDDPLRMLRAVRFRWKLGFAPAEGLYESIKRIAERLEIISMERIRDEIDKILGLPLAHLAFVDLMELGLLKQFAPEFVEMVGVDQGKYHHLDVWEHTLLVLKNAGHKDLALAWAALLHDVSKPETRMVDDDGNIRFYTHEVKGAAKAGVILRRLRYSEDFATCVQQLVKNHMRIGTAEQWGDSASRKLMRDLGENLERLLQLVDADANALRPGVRALDIGAIRDHLERVANATPVAKLESPLSGKEIMTLLSLAPGKEVGEVKQWLLERVLEGALAPDDVESARAMVTAAFSREP